MNAIIGENTASASGLWTEEFRTGLRIFDDQHKILFGMLDELASGTHDTVEIFDRFVEFKLTHLADEELAMKATGCPEYSAHASAHEDFAWRLTELKGHFIDTKPAERAEIIMSIQDWHLSHINEWDKKTCQFMRASDKALEIFLTWNDRHACGIRKFDDQHRQIFSIISKMYGEMKRTGIIPADVFDDLLDTITQHFFEEERAMRSIAYPYFKTHKMEHERLINEAVAFHQLYVAEKREPSLDVVWFLVSWAKNHMDMVDRAFFRYLSATNPPPRESRETRGADYSAR